MAARLTLDGVSLAFGGVRVLEDVSFEVEPGQVFGLVGPNGAGKTSLFNCISGHYRPSEGRIEVDGAEVGSARPATMAAKHRLARTFQHPALQLESTVLENVLLGGHLRLPGGPAEWALRLPRTRRSEREMRDEAQGILDRLGLGDSSHRSADELSHGLHKTIELARALLARPSLLLLDEPAAGLPHSEVEELIATVNRLRAEEDITIVIVEHHMGLIAALTDRVVVLDQGRVLMEGTAAQAQSDPRVIEAYIGKDDDGAA
jgi:branched-chain amino acid transport system ATP-binding protein